MRAFDTSSLFLFGLIIKFTDQEIQVTSVKKNLLEKNS